MNSEHIKTLAELEKLCFFSGAWSESAIRYELTNPIAHFFVAEQCGFPLAYAGMHSIIDEGYIANICTHPSHRSKGLGSALMDALINCALKNSLAFMTLEVRISNKTAIDFYLRRGFNPEGVRKNYYIKPTEDAYIMFKRWG
jgi:ribosomal-protein-alanine N-acetyltransferase